jgi:superfamily II DNA/RNA helicase
VDQCLEDDFRVHLEAVLSGCPADRQVVFCSATGDKDIVRQYAQLWMREPALLRVSGKLKVPANISHWSTVVPARMRIDVIRKLLYTKDPPTSAICFVDDPRRVDIVCERLFSMNVPAGALRGNAHKLERAEVIRLFRKGEIRLLVTTEVAARGLDVPAVSHVFNLDLPTDADHYIHRAGRCGRARALGTVVSIASPETAFVIRRLEKQLELNITPMELRGGAYATPLQREQLKQDDSPKSDSGEKRKSSGSTSSSRPERSTGSKSREKRFEKLTRTSPRTARDRPNSGSGSQRRERHPERNDTWSERADSGSGSHWRDRHLERNDTRGERADFGSSSHRRDRHPERKDTRSEWEGSESGSKGRQVRGENSRGEASSSHARPASRNQDQRRERQDFESERGARPDKVYQGRGGAIEGHRRGASRQQELRGPKPTRVAYPQRGSSDRAFRPEDRMEVSQRLSRNEKHRGSGRSYGTERDFAVRAPRGRIGSDIGRAPGTSQSSRNDDTRGRVKSSSTSPQAGSSDKKSRWSNKANETTDTDDDELDVWKPKKKARSVARVMRNASERAAVQKWVGNRPPPTKTDTPSTT